MICLEVACCFIVGLKFESMWEVGKVSLFAVSHHVTSPTLSKVKLRVVNSGAQRGHFSIFCYSPPPRLFLGVRLRVKPRKPVSSYQTDIRITQLTKGPDDKDGRILISILGYPYLWKTTACCRTHHCCSQGVADEVSVADGILPPAAIPALGVRHVLRAGWHVLRGKS